MYDTQRASVVIDYQIWNTTKGEMVMQLMVVLLNNFIHFDMIHTRVLNIQMWHIKDGECIAQLHQF